MIKANLKNCIYLEDQSLQIFGYKIYGSPWQTPHLWAAFQRNSDTLKQIWSKIPDDVDILMTHGPPYKQLDKTRKGVDTGCPHLLKEVLTRVKPILHCFGHIHESYGASSYDDVLFINSAFCDSRYKPVQPPFIIDLPYREPQKEEHMEEP